MMNKLTAKAGIASVIHKPMAKNNRNITYTCESVKPGSLRRNVIANATANDEKKNKILSNEKECFNHTNFTRIKNILPTYLLAACIS